MLKLHSDKFNSLLQLNVIIYTFLYLYLHEERSHHSEETKRKMSQKANRQERPQEVKDKISKSKLSNYHPYRGKELSEEHKQKISNSLKKNQIKEDSHGTENC